MVKINEDINNFCRLVNEINELNDYLKKNEDIWKINNFKGIYEDKQKDLKRLQDQFLDCFYRL